MVLVLTALHLEQIAVSVPFSTQVALLSEK